MVVKMSPTEGEKKPADVCADEEKRNLKSKVTLMLPKYIRFALLYMGLLLQFVIFHQFPIKNFRIICRILIIRHTLDLNEQPFDTLAFTCRIIISLLFGWQFKYLAISFSLPADCNVVCISIPPWGRYGYILHLRKATQKVITFNR